MMEIALLGFIVGWLIGKPLGLVVFDWWDTRRRRRQWAEYLASDPWKDWPPGSLRGLTSAKRTRTL